MKKIPDIIYAVLGTIFAVAIVQAATTGWEAFFLYLVIIACDVAYVYNKFRGRK